MANPPNSTNGIPAAPTNGAEEAGVEVRVLNQYIKDISFENPSATRQILEQGENPNLGIEFNVNAERLADTVYESTITIKAECKAKAGMVYVLECVYGAIFEIKNMPERTLEPFLLVNCPALTFPFLRRLVADVTREGGFPPLLLDPIDFAQLYLQRRDQAAAAAAQPAKS